MNATNQKTAPVIMALDREEVSKLIKAIKDTKPDFFATFSSIKIEQLKTDYNIFNVMIYPHENVSSTEIIQHLLFLINN